MTRLQTFTPRPYTGAMKPFTLLVLALASWAPRVAAAQMEGQSTRPPAVKRVISGSDYGGATPISPTRWINELRLPEIQYVPSRVVVAFDITRAGRARNCKARKPTRSSELSREICSAMERNARFKPARGALGNPIAVKARTTFRFGVLN
jgi:outer membrane biosynthesis protein TonB